MYPIKNRLYILNCLIAWIGIVDKYNLNKNNDDCMSKLKFIINVIIRKIKWKKIIRTQVQVENNSVITSSVFHTLIKGKTIG